MNQPVLREALSPQERYARELDALLAQVDRLEAQAVRRSLALLTEARRRIIAALAEVPAESFLATYLPRLQVAVEQAMTRYRTQYAALLNGQGERFWTLGAAVVDQPLAAAGLTSLVSQLPSLDPAMLDILQGVRASLITGISDQAVNRITTELQLGVLSGESPFQIQRTVADILRTQPDAAGRFGTVAARAEVVTRTELNRDFNLSTQARQAIFQDRVATVFPELQPQKVWRTAKDARVRPSHRRMEGQTVPVGGAFTLIGADGVTYKIEGPHDTKLPAAEAVSCRCRSVILVESLLPVLEGV